MNKPSRRSPPRPFSIARRHPRTRPEAAAELVRLEYERDRLNRDLSTVEQRRAQTLLLLSRVDQRVKRLQEMLS